jgi:SAM-dependent methyltransferase
MAKLLLEDAFVAPDAFPRGARILDLGCGESKKVPWAVGMDAVKAAGVDVVHDIARLPWPFKDGEFDVVVASHVLEHLPDTVAACRELHRVTKPGGLVRVVVPHYSSPDAFVDPTHLKAFGYRTFDYMARGEDAPLPRSQRWLNRLGGTSPAAPGWYTPALFEIVERRITFRKLHRLLGLERLAGHFPVSYEQYLAGLAPARCLLVLLRVKK